jgi:peroxiredoxin
VVLALVLGCLGLLALAVVVFGLMRQLGGVLVRLDELERQLDGQAVPAPQGDGGPVNGLATGTVHPPFALPDFAGRRWTLDELGDSGQVMLVHWSPSCGFCEQIADDLGALAPALRKGGTELALVSWGDVESNREFAEAHGLRCPILLVQGSEPIAPFTGLGTPVAYVLDEQRRVARPLAVGADDVLDLAHELAGRRRLRVQRPLRESRIERHGLRAGTPAPEFRLPDLDGGTVALADLRGRPVLLVFSDPGCNPCTALAPDLERLHEEHADDLAVVVVSRGDEGENRAKRDELGTRYPVVLQPGWRVSRDYGIFETPVAFLIDADGTIARDVARGAEEILALAASVGGDRREVALGH